jgi:hypothetical protein
MRPPKTKWIMLAAAIMLVLGLTAGSCSEKGKGDADVGRWDDTPAYVINMPDGFMNVAVKCDPAGFRIYAHTRPAPPLVIEDASCKGRTGVPQVYAKEGTDAPYDDGSG